MLYIAFCKGLFAGAPRGSYHWEEGECSEIYITDEHPIHDEVIGARPSISFTRGPVQFYSLGMGDMLTHDLSIDSRTKAVLLPGVMSINCSSRNRHESGYIAWTVSENLWLFREKLMGTNLFFEIGRQPQISATSSAEGIVASDSGQEWFCTTVSSSFQLPRKSKVTPLNQEVLRSIDVQLRTQGIGGSRSGPASTTNGDLPYNVQASPPPGYLRDASDVHGGTPDPGGDSQISSTQVAHPLDPARTVVVRTVHPNSPGMRPPSMAGRAIPIAPSSVEESSSVATLVYKTKV